MNGIQPDSRRFENGGFWLFFSIFGGVAFIPALVALIVTSQILAGAKRSGSIVPNRGLWISAIVISSLWSLLWIVVITIGLILVFKPFRMINQNRMVSLSNAGEFEKALEIARELDSVNSSRNEIRVLVIAAEAAQSGMADVDEVVSFLRQQAELANDCFIFKILAETLQSTGDIEGAIDAYEKALDVGTCPDLVLALGRLLRSAGRESDALAIYERACHWPTLVNAEESPLVADILAIYDSGDFRSVVQMCEEKLGEYRRIEWYIGRGVGYPLASNSELWIGDSYKIMVYGGPFVNNGTMSQGRIPGWPRNAPKQWSEHCFYSLPCHDRGAVIVCYYYGKALIALNRDAEAVEAWTMALYLAITEEKFEEFFYSIYVPRKHLGSRYERNVSDIIAEIEDAMEMLGYSYEYPNVRFFTE